MRSSALAQSAGPLEPPPSDVRSHRATEIAIDGSYGAAGSSGLDLGGGAALRAGYAFPVGIVTFVPEGGIDAFSFSPESGRPHGTVYSAFGGSRLRVGRGLEPGVFAHVGVAGVNWRDDYVAPAVDVGLFMELTYIRWLILGVQGEYKSTIGAGGNPSLTWYTFGLTAGVRLGGD